MSEFKRITDKERVKQATKILRFVYGKDAEWGKIGTVNDKGWREAEGHCLRIVDFIIEIQLDQDTADQEEERRALGEWLDGMPLSTVTSRAIELGRGIKALKQGELPEGTVK
jgi:hypothetical protein